MSKCKVWIRVPIDATTYVKVSNQLITGCMSKYKVRICIPIDDMIFFSVFNWSNDIKLRTKFLLSNLLGLGSELV
ncbi:hypothetical protein Leryth_015652 [Lithospermum erythrorhizon]|nr:hypothetical protein Leryth_015652 [Lithospermum erythrorhizon]